MARTVRRLLTADARLTLPMGHGVRYELVERVPRAMPPGGRRHGRLIVRFTAPAARERW